MSSDPYGHGLAGCRTCRRAEDREVAYYFDKEADARRMLQRLKDTVPYDESD
jgi:hypothetical protein